MALARPGRGRAVTLKAARIRPRCQSARGLKYRPPIRHAWAWPWHPSMRAPCSQRW